MNLCSISFIVLFDVLLSMAVEFDVVDDNVKQTRKMASNVRAIGGGLINAPRLKGTFCKCMSSADVFTFE